MSNCTSSQLERFFELSRDMLCIARMDGYFISVNPAFQRILGYSVAELTEQPFLNLVHPEDKDITEEEMRRLRTGSITQNFENRYLCKDGSYKWISWSATPDASHSLIYAVARDLTDRKKLEEYLRKMNSDLETKVALRTREFEQALKLRDEFISIASHELKTPLTTLKLRAQIRKREIAKGVFLERGEKEILALFEDDEAQIHRITRLIDDMLEVSRLRSGNFLLQKEDIDLTHVVNTMIERFNLDIHQTSSLNFIKQESVVGFWDVGRLEQIITNLISNALKYGNGHPVEIGVERIGSKARLTVSDQGVGIPEKDFPKMFQLFQRAETCGSIKGLGLGLFIVKHIVEAHGGQIHFTSAVDQGTTFCVDIPLRTNEYKDHKMRLYPQ